MRDPRIIHDEDAPPPAPWSGAVNAPLTISVSARTIGIIVALFVLWWIVQELSGTLVIFGGAMLLATAIDKPASAMQRHGVPRGLALLVIFMAIVALLALIVALLIPLVNEEARQLAKDLPDYQKQFEDFLHRFHAGNSSTEISLDSITQGINNNIQTITTQLTSITLEIGHTAVVIFVTLVIAFMMGMNPTAASDYAERFLTPTVYTRFRRITRDIDGRIGTWVRGQVLVAISFGLLFGIGLWVIGIPFAASIALIACVLEVIPYLGGAVTLLLAIIVALGIGLPQVVFVIVLYTVLINIESHILAPLLIGDAVGLPSVVVLAALFVGLETKGIVGVLLAVPTVLVVAAILDEFWPGSHKVGAGTAIARVEGWALRMIRSLMRTEDGERRTEKREN